ncbi:MAG: hypothetical protein JXA50_04740 [Deltaproteobacteria bacterium]|nr:hypothetical protein [Deltaproteobacteria bacterium]
MMKRIVLFFVLSLFFCGVSSVGWGQGPIVVLGKSERSETVPSPTLEMALTDGLVRAVEEVVKGMVTPQTLTRRHETLSQEFYQKADAFVLSYKILEKTVIPTGYQALVEVVVDSKGIEARLASLGLLSRGERAAVRTIRLVVSGIRSYQTYLAVEKILKENSEIQEFSLSEIEPTKFTWQVSLRGEVGGLANKFLSYAFSDSKARVVSLTPHQLEITLSR